VQYPDRPEVRKRLRTLEIYDDEKDTTHGILKKRVLSEVPFLNGTLSYLPGARRLDLMIRQANAKYTLGFFLLSGMVLGLMGYLLVSLLTGNLFLAVLMALVAGCVPFFYVRTKKNKRMEKFEKQLPEGLGLIARALRAGHAFTSGMKLASDEFGDPLGPEFEETLDEINFGMNVPDALKNLSVRVDCPDLKFFVVSVILQRETGGNLAEIIDNLSYLIRERFKFKGKVRVLTAEGRLSAAILLVLPFVLFGVLLLVNRKFIEPLMVDPIGKGLLVISALMMTFGILVIKRIINVDV
jgi:tight adherence protein B